jgi:uncharacterized spore protein YtfJ
VEPRVSLTATVVKGLPLLSSRQQDGRNVAHRVGVVRRVMKVNEIMSTARDSLTVKRVFGDPYERDELIVIPAASVSGGGGGGTGHDEKGQEGEGGGFGVNARPAGAYVIKDGQVSWRPAVDVNRVITTVGLIVIVYLLTRPRMARAHARSAGGSSAG